MNNSFTLPTDDEMNPTILKEFRKEPDINIHRLMTLLPSCYKPYLDLVKGIYQLDLDKRLREVAICRVAAKAHSPYEYHQHQFIAKANGINQQELEFILSEDPVKFLDEEANFICKVVDEIEVSATLSDKTFNEICTRYNREVALGFIMTISLYCCIARILNATRLPIEKDSSLDGRSSPANLD